MHLQGRYGRDQVIFECTFSNFVLVSVVRKSSYSRGVGDWNVQSA